MRLLFTLLSIFLSTYLIAQTTLVYGTNSDTTINGNVGAVYYNVGNFNGNNINAVVSINGYNSSNPTDVNWYNSVDFNSTNGSLYIVVPHSNNYTRCVSITITYVESANGNCVTSDILNTVIDTDNNSLRNEFFTTTNLTNYNFNNPTFMSATTNGSDVRFNSSSNSLYTTTGSYVYLEYQNTCAVNYDFCVRARNSGGVAVFYLNTILDSIQFLPLSEVILTKFFGDNNKCTNYINFETSRELNAASIDLEYSSDGVNFVRYNSFYPNNAGDSISKYNFVSGTELNLNYYRLKINLAESFFYSDVIFIESNCEDNFTEVYPNPFSDNITISSELPMQSVHIYDAIGQLISTEMINSSSYSLVNTEGLVAGDFIVKVLYSNGLSKVFKLQKYL